MLQQSLHDKAAVGLHGRLYAANLSSKLVSGHDTLFASLTRYHESKCNQQNCVYLAFLSSKISVGSICQRNFYW